MSNLVANVKSKTGVVHFLEVVFPRGWEGAVRDYRFATVFLVDVHGNRHQLPSALMPGVYYKKIVKGIQQEVPTIVLEERFDSSNDSDEA